MSIPASSSPINPATIVFPTIGTTSSSSGTTTNQNLDELYCYETIPPGYKPFISEYAKKIAAKQCLLINLKEKQAKYTALIDNFTLPPNTPKTLVTAYNNAVNPEAKLEFVKSACRNLDQRDNIRKQNQLLTTLELQFITELRLFLATAGITHSDYPAGGYHSWLQSCIRHHRLQFAANQLLTKKTKPIEAPVNPMDEDTEVTVDSLLARIQQLEQSKSNTRRKGKNSTNINKTGKNSNQNTSHNSKSKSHFTKSHQSRGPKTSNPNASNTKGNNASTNQYSNNTSKPSNKTGTIQELDSNNEHSHLQTAKPGIRQVESHKENERIPLRVAFSRPKKTVRNVSNPNKTLSDDLPSITNEGFTNLSNDNLTSVAKLLGYGLKFIPKPTQDINFETLKPYLDNLTNKALWRYHFSFQSELNTRTEEFNPKLISKRVSNYTGMMEPVMKGCISAFESSIKTIIKSTPPVKFNTHPSVHKLKQLSKDLPSTKIVAADKNLGLVAINTKHYNELVMDHLSDTNTYRKIGPMAENEAFIANLISDIHPRLLRTVNIQTNQEERYLRTPLDQVPKFHIIPKIHKTPLKGRPIVGATNWVTTPFSVMLDIRLQSRMLPLNYPSILKDSNDLISRWLDTPFDPESDWLVSLDVSSLYTNINIPRAVEIISQINPNLGILARLIMENNYFTYNNDLYHQIEGIAMGTNAAVVIANLYMSVLIDSKLSILPGITNYCRFIDDIGFIFVGNEPALLDLIARANDLQPGIKLTHVYSKTELDILDLTFYPKEGKLAHKTFQKTMNKYLYIPPFSYHPKPTIRGFILGELTRYHRTNSSYSDELAIRHLFFHRLLQRGYSQSYLDTILKDFTSTLGLKTNNEGNHLLINPRNSFIAAPLLNSTLYCPLPFIPTPRTKSIVSFIRSHDNPLLTLLQNEEIKTVWSTLPSISRLVLRSNLSTAQSAYLASHLLPPTEDNGYEGNIV